MEKIKVKKVEYVGDSNFYEFTNLETGEKVYQEITKEQHDDYSSGRTKPNEVACPEGTKLSMVIGGAIKMDTGYYLRKGEGCIRDGRYYVIWEENGEQINTFSEEEFNNKFIWQ